MNQLELANLIKRYKSGLATSQEKDELEKIWSFALSDDSPLNSFSRQEREEIGKHILSKIKGEIAVHRAAQRVVVFRPWLKAAAAVLILALASVWAYTRLNRFTEVQTSFGEQLTITLPDHSSIVLNGNSTLRYQNEWNENEIREVWIDGEGFFDVQHTRNHQKFIVHADQLDLEVLGTKFNLRSRESKSEVMLTEGKVKLDLPDHGEMESIFLAPGELATMANQKISKRVVQSKKYTAWVMNKLFFDRTTLGEVAALLKETYGLEVTFNEPELKDRELSGEISSATAEAILLAIGETFNLTVERKGQSVIISSNSEP